MIGILLISAGFCLPLFSVPLSSAYDGRDSFLWRIIRVIWTGEIILREAVIKIVPDRDEELHREFMEYRARHSELQSMPEDQLIDAFYNEKYRDAMTRVAFGLKLEKKQVVTIRRKIALPNLYVFAAGVLMIIAGITTRIYAGRESRNKIINP